MLEKFYEEIAMHCSYANDDIYWHVDYSFELYPRQKLSGQWIKTIHFKFPMYYNDNNEASCAVCFDMNGNFLPKKSTDESVVTLVKQEAL